MGGREELRMVAVVVRGGGRPQMDVHTYILAEHT